MAKPRLFGADYSVYVRICRMALAEKGVDYEFSPVDIFAPGGPPGWYLDRKPFGRIPAFEHEDFRLYETAAITRYVDEAFRGPALQPAPPARCARMMQMIGILDSYAYRTLVWDIYVETVSKSRDNEETDEARVAAALPKAATCLSALGGLKAEGPWLLGERLTLADLHAAPIFAYFTQAPMAARMLADQPGLVRWWERMTALPSFAATEPTS